MYAMNITNPISFELKCTSSISHALYLLDSLLRRLYNDSDLIFKDTVKETAIFPICKKIYRNTAGSEKKCFQQQQN